MADLGEDNANNGGAAERSKVSLLAQPKFLKAPVLNDPFARIAAADDGPAKPAFANPFASAPAGDAAPEEAPKAETDDATADRKPKDDETVPKFVPLQASKESVSFPGSSVTAPTPTGLSRATGFVFGQNLKERVVVSEDSEEGATSKRGATNGSADFLFSSVAKPAAESQSTSKEDGDSLTKSAETWERMRESSRVLPSPQKVLTGEEDETNRLQMNCRLYAFEGGAWKERGRAQLRLNDSSNSSRLVCRSSGSLRILINTKVWSGMTVDRAGNKSLRVTATDFQQQLKVFLIMASPDEISQLHKALVRRVETAANSNEPDDNPPESASDRSDEAIGSDADDSNPNRDGDSENNISTASDDPADPSSAPVVVVPSEGDRKAEIDGESLKRSADEESSTPKKMCTEFPIEDDSRL